MNTEKIPVLKTIKETSIIVGLARYHLRQLVKQNKIKIVMAGQKCLINLDSLIASLNKGEVKTETVEQNETVNKIERW